MATNFITPEEIHRRENLEHQNIPSASAEGDSLEKQIQEEMVKPLESGQQQTRIEANAPVLPSLGRPSEAMTEKEFADLGLDTSLATNPTKISQSEVLEGLLNDKRIDTSTATDANAIQDALLH